MLDVARIFIYAFITAIVVLTIDLFALLMLDLLTDANMLPMLLFWEGFLMMLVGAAGWGAQEHYSFTVGWKRPEIHHVNMRPRYPVFCLSLAVAGVMLFLVSLYLIGQRY